MAKKLLCTILSAVMILSCFGTLVYAEDKAELAADWTSAVMAVKGNSFAYETKNYSESYAAWDEETGYYYMHYVSADRTDSDNLSAGPGNQNFYIGRWGMTPIPVNSLGGKVYVGMIVRTNSASTPMYQPMTLVPDTSSIGEQIGSSAFVADGSWEFNSVDLVFSSATETFAHGQLRFCTEDDKYLDLAAWGIFPSTMEKSDAEAALRSAAICTDSEVKIVEICGKDGNVEETHALLKGSVTLPDYEDTDNSAFLGWTDTEGSYTVVADGGAAYTPTDDVTLYPVWVDYVRFVDDTAETNGNGLTAQTPYNSFALAAADLAISGGTIVVMGTEDETGNVEQSTFTTLSNTGDIVITSVYDGVDYRTYGAKLYVSNSRFGYVENPGKVIFDDINITSTSWGNWHLHGHETVITDTCIITDANGADITNVQLLALISTGGNYAGNVMPDTHMNPLKITVGNSNCDCIILGPCEDITIGNADITVDGYVKTISISNNTWTNYDHGMLSIDGDVTITVNGRLNSINARSTLTDGQYSLRSFNGKLSVIVNNGATFDGTISDHVKNMAENWFVIRNTDDVMLSHGENGGDIIFEIPSELDYNFVNLTNTTTNTTYAYFIENGKTEFTLTESGNYTMTLTKNESKTVTFEDHHGGRTAEPITTIAGLDITLPSLENTDTLVFEGWTSEENGTEVEYEGGAKYTVTDNVTLYAVWTQAETYTVTFMANGEEFDTFIGIEGKTVVYPEAYPEKDGYYFKKWDKTIDKIGTEDVTINAEFVSREETGYIYYWNSEAATDGDGSYNRPFKLMASLIAQTNKTGGTVVLLGKCENIYSPRATNTEDIIFTSVDPVTGVDYRGGIVGGEWVGGCIYMTTGTFWGGASYKTGALIFEDVDLVNVKGQYGYMHFTFEAHPFVIGENVRLVDSLTGEDITWFLGATSAAGASEPHDIKAVFKRSISGANWLARGEGAYTIDSIDYTFTDGGILNIAQDSSMDVITLNGAMKFTFNGNSTASNTRLYHGKSNYAFGAKAYASLIINDGGAIRNDLDLTAETGLDGRMFVVKSSADGNVVHTDIKGGYLVTSDTYNYAQLIDANGAAVDEAIIVGGAVLTASEYGEYTVSYSNRDIYQINYSTSLYEEICPEPYAVSSDDTDNHTIILPALDNQNAHKFLGWTTTENGETAEFEGGTEYTLTGIVTMYAVWEAIPTCTVTFKNDDGETIHTVTGYVGMKLTFPENNPYKYGEKLLGYAYEGTTDILGANAVIPNENKVAVPVWGDIPAGETRIYVDASKGNNDNSGISPDNAVATIAKAVEILRENGGYIIVCGGANTLEGGWNNKGDITLTSLDPVTGIDYRADTLSEDKLTWKDGAYIMHKPISLGYVEIEGKITFENITIGSSADYTYINFNGHPYEIGLGINYFRKDADNAQIALDQRLFTRSLGEIDSKKMNPEGLVMTFNTVNKQYVPHILGKAELDIPRVEITINSEFPGNLNFSNDSGGGKATVTGDVFITANANAKGFIFGQNYTNPIEGNIYAIYNNNSTCNISSLLQTDDYAKYTVTAGVEATLAHGETSGDITFTLNDGYDYGYVLLKDADKNIAECIEVVDGKGEFTIPYSGDFTLDYSDIPVYSITFETGDDTITVPTVWYEAGTEVEILTDVYKYGYKFRGWTDGSVTYDKGLYVMPEANVTLTAIWDDAPKYTITFDANGSDIAVPADITDYHGENAVLPKVPSESASFIGWNTDKSAKTGYLNHTIESDTTLYAITTTEPAYIVNSYYRGDPNDYTGARCQFRRYVIDVYLENAVASEGSFKLNTANDFLYYLGHVPQEGIDAAVTAPVSSGTVAGVPGLQKFTTNAIEFKWQSDEPIDTTGGRIKIASIMMYFSTWGLGYSEIESRTTDEIVSPFEGYIATVGENTAYISSNFWKGIKTEEVDVSGKITLEGRESGTTPLYDFAKLYLLDTEGDAVGYIVLENENTDTRTFTYSASVNPGEYTLRVVKNGYITRNVKVNVEGNCTLPDIVLHSGDTVDENGVSDGVVDIDDFIRVLRGFSAEFPTNLRYAIDLDEDGRISVTDLAYIKTGFSGKSMTVTETASSVDSAMKVGDWKVKAKEGVVTIFGGSNAALDNALTYVNEKYMNGDSYTGPETFVHNEEYSINDITVGGVSLEEYRIVIAENDDVALTYANYIRDYMAETSGIGLDIVYDTEDAYEYEIIVGSTARQDSTVTEMEKYHVFEENGRFCVFYGDEQSAEMAALDLCEKILGKESSGFDGMNVTVESGESIEGAWSVLTRFGVMSDTHVGEGKNWANYDWLDNTFTNFENIHAENPLDFLVSLGDNVDDGYLNTYERDYNEYLEQMKKLDICDPVNPVEGRAEGKIPHYEICGNHDPIGIGIGGAEKIRFMKNGLWYTENEYGEKVAHIAFFTDYGGYPLYNNTYSGSTESYRSYGIANDEMVAYVENSIIAANEAGAKHIILYNHYGISQQVGSPVLPETGLEKIAAVCEKYDIKLYFNGHEHDNYFTLRRYGDIYDYDASMTANKHAVVEITTLRAKVTVYNSKDNTVYREDIIPLSGRGEAKQTLK